jgi:formylmethanofuran dehydrogenase subunit B
MIKLQSSNGDYTERGASLVRERLILFIKSSFIVSVLPADIPAIAVTYKSAMEAALQILKISAKEKNMFNWSYVSALMIAIGLSVTTDASALEAANGLSVNGLSVNGIEKSAGLSLKAITLQDGQILLIK